MSVKSVRSGSSNMTEDRLHELLRLGRTGPAKKGWRCPGPMTVAAYADGKLEGKSRHRFERHLADCNYCLNELAFLVRAEDPGQEYELSSEALARARSFAETKVSFTLRPAWRWAAASAATVLLALVTTFELREPPAVRPSQLPGTGTSEKATSTEPFVYQPSGAAPPSARNAQQTGSVPELIFPPEGALVAREKLNFRWHEVQGTTDYEILVVTAEGNLVWQGRTDRTDVQLPDNVTVTARQGYFVWVRANLPEGKAAKSAVVSFRIAKPAAP